MTLITAGEAARIIGVSTEYVRQLANAGRLRHERTPYGWRVYDYDSVVAFSNGRYSAKVESWDKKDAKVGT